MGNKSKLYGKNWKAEREKREKQMRDKEKLEKIWLEGLRPSLKKGQTDFNLDTKIERGPSPDKLFNTDDEWEFD